MIYREKYKVELEDIGISNRISNKRIITIMEDIVHQNWSTPSLNVKIIKGK